MGFSDLPPEVTELIFSEVVWDGFKPESLETLNKASECIEQIHKRNHQLRSLRLTAKFVDRIANRLSYKYLHITSRKRAEELINAPEDFRLPGVFVRHLFLGDKSGRFDKQHAPSYTWVTAESGKEWIEEGTFFKLLELTPGLNSLHIHLPAIHSQIFSSSIREGLVAPLKSLEMIQCLSLYDDINNSHCYRPVERTAGVRDSLSVFRRLKFLIVSESEGMLRRLDRLTGCISPEKSIEYAPNLERISLEKWCPMGHDFILYNIAMEVPLSELSISRCVPRRMSLQDVLVIIRKIGPTLTSLSLDFSCHFADDLDSTNVHLCAEIRDSCQNLEYLTLSFPPSDNLHDAPRPNVCHQLFRAPTNLLTRGPGMRNLKKAEILGYHGYCEGSSRKMVIEASEEVWARQRQSWEPGEPEIGSAHECLHTNIQIHGTPAGKASLLNCRELRGISGTLPQLRSGRSKEQKAHVGTVYESSSIWDLILISPIRTLDQGCYRRRSPRRQNGKK